MSLDHDSRVFHLLSFSHLLYARVGRHRSASCRSCDIAERRPTSICITLLKPRGNRELLNIPSMLFEPPAEVQTVPKPPFPDHLDPSPLPTHEGLRIRPIHTLSFPILGLLLQQISFLRRLGVDVDCPGDFGGCERGGSIRSGVGDDQVRTFPVEAGRVFPAEFGYFGNHALTNVGYWEKYR
jgi:hypothetical protein